MAEEAWGECLSGKTDYAGRRNRDGSHDVSEHHVLVSTYRAVVDFPRRWGLAEVVQRLRGRLPTERGIVLVLGGIGRLDGLASAGNGGFLSCIAAFGVARRGSRLG